MGSEAPLLQVRARVGRPLRSLFKISGLASIIGCLIFAVFGVPVARLLASGSFGVGGAAVPVIVYYFFSFPESFAQEEGPY